MKLQLTRILSDYGMVVVLLLLCIFFSVVTYTEQSDSGAAAVDQLQKQIESSDRVMIVGSATTEDAQFAKDLENKLTAQGLSEVATVLGDPREARIALEASPSDRPINVVACSEQAGRWLLLADLSSEIPSLAGTRVIKPRTYRYPNFLKTDNLLNIANQIAVIAIVAIGMTMVIVAGGIDLSVGSLIALSAVLTSVFIRDYGGGTSASPIAMIACCAAATLLCGCFGGFSGFMVTKFRIPPFIVTLAMMLVGSGLAYILAEGQSISVMPDSFVWLGRGADFFGIPNAVAAMFGLYILAHILMSQMRLGRYIYAVGGNHEASLFSGIPIHRVIFITYLASGLLAGLGGVIMASQLKSGSPTYGSMYELYVIAAVVVGGTSLSGGKGRMFGTLIGAFTIAVIQNGMNLTNVESYTQKVVLGLVILAAVLLDKLRNR